MALKIKFVDYSAKVTAELDEATFNFLEEAGSTVEDRVKKLTRVDSGKTRDKWDHVVDKAGLKVTVGNPLENAIWEERGTGEYALYGKGRKGGWWIPAKKLDPRTIGLFESKYNFIKSVDEDTGEAFYFTRGKKGTRALHKAFKNSKGEITKKAKAIFKELDSK